MDLILAHRRSMRLGELVGLSLSAQTTFATAVSEVARNTIEHGKNGCLILQVNVEKRDRYIVATIIDEEPKSIHYQGLTYARRLVSKSNLLLESNKSAIELYYDIASSVKIDVQKLDEWRRSFHQEAALSPYEEIKRKNDQLQDLAQKLQKSEQQYKMLTNSLPIIIFSLDQAGNLIYANEWLRRFTGRSLEQLNHSQWKDVVYPADYDRFALLLNPKIPAGASDIKTQCRIRHISEEDYYWHLASISPLNDSTGELLYWIGYIVDIHAQKVVEETLQNNKELIRIQSELKEHQQALEVNIAELNRSNQELEQFAYVASHDLQEPLRKIQTFSRLLVQKNDQTLDEESRLYLSRMTAAAQRMQMLIHNLLEFSRIGRKEAPYQHVDLNQVLTRVLTELDEVIVGKHAVIHKESLPVIWAEPTQMQQLLTNLISNSLKFSKNSVAPHIQIQCRLANAKEVAQHKFHKEKNYWRIDVVDNGIGFDPVYSQKIFSIFQRLHGQSEYPGSGIGLAICRKIIENHGGTISADSVGLNGAVFTLFLPEKSREALPTEA